MLKIIDSFWLSFANKVKIGTYSFASLIAKMILLELASAFSMSAETKAQCPVYLSFNSTLKLINGISSHLLKLPKHFKGNTIVVSF